MRTLVSQLQSKVGTEVTLYLTLEVLRDQKHLQFILAKDHTGTIQLVVSKSKVAGHEEVSQLLPGSAFIVKGTAVQTQQSKTFGIEIQVSEIKIVSKAEPYPITQESSIDLRFDYRAVDLRFPRQQLMLRVKSAFEQGCREFMLQKGLTEVQTPKLISRASESGSEVFKVEYFGETAYLAQSPQEAKQLLCQALDSVFMVSDVYRAESSFSTRHLTQFTGIDCEVCWIFETEELMQFEEEMLMYAFSKLEPYSEEVKKLYGIELPTKPTVCKMTLARAKQILKEKAGMSLSAEKDLPDEGERMLYGILGIDLIFITDYPIAKRPFYHMWEKEKGTTKSFDLLFRGIEITSGAVREHRLEVFDEQVIAKGVSLESVEHYRKIFKYGAKPHGGFGIGSERVVSKLLGITVKESSPLPRDPQRLTP